MTNPTTPTAEIATLRRIASLLERLDAGAQIRVVAWIWERYMGVPHEAPRAGELSR